MSDNKLVKSLLDAATITGLVARIGLDWFELGARSSKKT